MQTPPNPKQAADQRQLDRLAASMKQAAGTGWQDYRYGVAVSGGPDSMALLWLMTSLLADQISAATVDHGFRLASADEARMVAGYCAREHIAHQTLRPAAPITGSLQAAARQERYRLLEQWRRDSGLDFIITAHHADDQLETLLMRLNRSSGVAGLSGIRRRNGAIIRPLLDWRRRELLDVALDEDIPFIDDPSNADQRFDRARLRHALQAQTLIDAEAASRSAAWLADADEALDWATEAAISQWPDPHDLSILHDASYPPELFRRIITRRIRAHDPELKLRGVTLDAVIAAMRLGRRAMVGALIIDRDPHSDTIWRISAAPRRKTGKKP